MRDIGRKTPIFRTPFNLHDNPDARWISFQNFTTNCPSP